MDKAGVFITFEGIDGCGKTTQATMLAEALEAAGREVVRLRDPGSARLSERIRLLVLDPANDDMCDECELLLYEAARAQMVRECIIPALERGAVVLCDRFCDSTLAYQAGGRGIDRKLVEAANEIGSVGVVPDATLLFRLGVDEALSRATQEGADRLEGEGVGFQERVNATYARIAEEGAPRVRVIDAVGSPEIVRMRVQNALADIFG